MSIVEFLRARYGERRAVALAAEADRIEAVPLYEGVAYLTLRGDHPDRYTGELPAPLADHVAANDPASVLADLDAKFAILEEHPGNSSYVYTDDGTPACATCGDSTVKHPCRTLRLLAVPFDAHPGYDERWRP